MRLRDIGGALRAALAALAVGVVAGCAGTGSPPQAGVQRLYAFNCGESKTTDLSRWAPDVPKGTPYEFSANCYLIRHARGLMLWDSGIPDSVATMPNGFVTGGGTLTYRLPKPFRTQLAEIGVSPEQVTHIAFSHTHGDHVGNANLFTRATLFIQQAEYDAAFGPDASKYGFQPANYGKLRDNPTVPLRGDHDVFGDGSVVILSTSGHTPGHQSLLVRLPKTGPVVLSGDMVHTRENWERRRIPGMNVDKAQTAASMEKVARILEAQRATLWINHDKAQSAGIPRAPAHIESSGPAGAGPQGLSPGDAVIIHTGWGKLYGKDNARFMKTAPGIGVGAAEWQVKQDPLRVGSDNWPVEVAPNPDPQ